MSIIETLKSIKKKKKKKEFLLICLEDIEKPRPLHERQV